MIVAIYSFDAFYINYLSILQVLFNQCVDALYRLPSNPWALPGAGCFETVLARTILRVSICVFKSSYLVYLISSCRIISISMICNQILFHNMIRRNSFYYAISNYFTAIPFAIMIPGHLLSIQYAQRIELVDKKIM